uniref:NAD(P)(+)--arginine ADP-ribosyltransferase n=1 Tax=Hucho hucho TaxID=62062 RepID=A0A4W5MSH3_9TELE
DMAPDSIDDSYEGCRKNVLCEVTNNFLPKEKKKYRKFQCAWWEAMEFYDNHEHNIELSNDHLRAIHVYVNPTEMIFKPLNEATTLGKRYTTVYKYHSLYFLLSDALRILNKDPGKQCVETFHGTWLAYEGIKDDIMRFGPFASSSTYEHVAKMIVDWKTCFKIATCFGASLAGVSQLNDEEEVLIPPYEVFKIAKVTKNKVLEDKDKDDKSEFEIVYELESTKTTKSDLNCHIDDKDKK